jgi:uncharacterized protein
VDPSAEPCQPARDGAVRVHLRPVGTPLPLGFLALAFATTAFAVLQLGWVSSSESHSLAVAVLLFTVPLQLLASVFGFLCRDAVAGTGMGLLAGTWAVTAVLTLRSPPGTHSPALATALLTAAVLFLVPAVAAGGKLVAAAVMATSAVRYAVTGVAEAVTSPAWTTAAGAMGLLLAVVALYAAPAFELEDARHRTVLPLLRRGAGSLEAQDTDAVQLSRMAREAGVREQL